MNGVVGVRILELRPGWGPRRVLYALLHDTALAGWLVGWAGGREPGVHQALVRTGLIDPQADRDALGGYPPDRQRDLELRLHLGGVYGPAQPADRWREGMSAAVTER